MGIDNIFVANKSHMTVTPLLLLSNELKKIRKIPQLLYCCPIIPQGTLLVRKTVLDFKKNNPGIKEIDLILNSPGGSGDDAYRIIRTLRKNFEVVNVVVPFWSKSAATLLALGGSSIIMDECGEFGALDVQLPKQKDDSPSVEEAESALIDEISLETIEKRSHRLFLEMFVSLYHNEFVPIHKNDIANDILDYLSNFYEPLLKQINPYKIGDKKRKLEIGAQYGKRILIQYQPLVTQSERETFIDYLVNDCPSHGYIVDYDLIKKYLKNVAIKPSVDLDKEYKGYSDALTNLSMYLMRQDSDKDMFIGFIEDKLFADVTATSAMPASAPPIKNKKAKQVKFKVGKKFSTNGQKDHKSTAATA